MEVSRCKHRNGIFETDCSQADSDEGTNIDADLDDSNRCSHEQVEGSGGGEVPEQTSDPFMAAEPWSGQIKQDSADTTTLNPAINACEKGGSSSDLSDWDDLDQATANDGDDSFRISAGVRSIIGVEDFRFNACEKSDDSSGLFDERP